MPRISRKPQSDKAIDSQPIIRIYKTAIYSRLSVEDIRKKISDSIGTQKAMLMAYMHSQPDMQLYDTYEDINYTGTNFNRPGFTRMIEDIQAGLVDCVLVKDLSRFGRSFEEMGHYLERVFPFLQVRFVAVNDKFDSLTATLDESGLIVPIKNLMNEIYARDISKKVQSGFKAKQQRGEFCGSFAPYGYIKEGASLVIDDDAAKVVKQIFEWRIDGMGIAAIVQKLNGLNIHPPSKHRFSKGITKARKHEESLYWYSSAVKRILSNPVYTGSLAQGRYKSNFLSGGRPMEVEESEWLVIKGAHPSIIAEETFESVRQIRKVRQSEFPWGADNPTDNIFRGLIICGDCGKHMARQRRRSKFSYVCYVYKSVSKQACTKKVIKEADLHSALYAYIKCEINLAVDMSRIIGDLQKRQSYKNHQSIMDKQMASLERKLEQNRRFRGSLREDFKDGILTEQDYISLKADYDDERKMLQLSLDELSAEKAKLNEIVSTENKWLTEFRRFESEQQLSAGMVAALIKQIMIFDGMRVEVTLRYRDELESLQGYLHDYDGIVRAVNE